MHQDHDRDPQRLDLYVHFSPLEIQLPHHDRDAEIIAKLDKLAKSIAHLEKIIMATQAELAQQLRDITAQNEAARVEILQKIADLEAALANGGGTTPEVDDAVAALKASVQTDDDIVPNPPPVEPAP